jgi:hypothetical protein
MIDKVSSEGWLSRDVCLNGEESAYFKVGERLEGRCINQNVEKSNQRWLDQGPAVRF